MNFFNRYKVNRAVKQERPIRFTYERSGQPELNARVLSPYEILRHKDGSRTVRGWDHSREDIRSFRLDRIEQSVKRADKLVAFEPAKEVA